MDKCGQACPYNTLDGCKVKEYSAICPLTNMATPIAECKMTNADRLNVMSIEDKAQFLYSIAYARETPWSRPFYEKFCKNCPAPEYTLDDGRKLCLHKCDFKDGECPHGTDIVWWLQKPAEE